MNLKNLLVEKPLRYLLHKLKGTVKGEIIFLQLVGPAGDLFDDLVADRLEELFRTTVQFGREFLKEEDGPAIKALQAAADAEGERGRRPKR